eukprot:TRINITY_DN9793_c0_g1_i1.p1 TRINITY_DN9793_c0_g1~~TRINITY_DN9793_c0_g1_i1.p1  ORF type:complete len:199 (+),score=27.38 TRINITY_DN9793_c0_g1_i1:214-810(+)
MSQQQQKQHTYVCSGCGLMNAYPAGSQLVACAKCQQVSNVAPQAASLTIPCTNCRTVLAFPPATKLANCPLCNAVFSIQTHVLPPGVQLMTNPNVHVFNMYSNSGPSGQQAQPQPQQQQQQQQPNPKPEESRRPTTASTRVASKVNAPKEETTQGKQTDWSDIWQAKPVADDERLALMQEFDAVTEQRDVEWSQKKNR